MLKNLFALIGFGTVVYYGKKLFDYAVEQRVGHIVNHRNKTH